MTIVILIISSKPLLMSMVLLQNCKDKFYDPKTRCIKAMGPTE